MRPNRREFLNISFLTLAGLALGRTLEPNANANKTTPTNKAEALMKSAEKGNIEWNALLKNEGKVTATLARHNIANPHDSFFDIFTAAVNARGDYPRF